MIGHSVGEYVAACLAGVFTRDDALRLVAERGRLMQALPPGAMLAVGLPEAAVRAEIAAPVSLAAVNAPGLCVVSGPSEAIAALAATWAGRGVMVRRLETSHAFHSAMMAPAVAAFEAAVAAVPRQAPTRRFISNVTGTWITAAEATAAAYWGRHLREAVQFAAGVATVASEGPRVYAGSGAGADAGDLREADQPALDAGAVLTSLPHPQEEKSDVAHLLGALGRLWSAGLDIDWTAFSSGEQRRRVPLPTYPFQRQRYWIEKLRTEGGARAPLSLVKAADLESWFYAPAWVRAARPVARAEQDPPATWLVFEDRLGISVPLVERLSRGGNRVIRVRIGETCGAAADGAFTVNPAVPAHYDQLIERVAAGDAAPLRIVHLWSVGDVPLDGPGRRLRAGTGSGLLQRAQPHAGAGASWRRRSQSDRCRRRDAGGGRGGSPSGGEEPGGAAVHGDYPGTPGDSLGDRRHRAKRAGAPRTDGGAACRGAGRTARGAAGGVPRSAALGAAIRNGGHRDGMGRRRPAAARGLRHHRRLRTRRPGDRRAAGGTNVAARLVLIGRIRRLRIAVVGRRRAVTAGGRHHRPPDPRHPPPRTAGRRGHGRRGRCRPTNSGFGMCCCRPARVSVRSTVCFTPRPLPTVPVSRPLVNLDRHGCEAQFRPKVQGVYALERAIAGLGVDFCVLTSSLSAVLGGLGFGAYAAANRFEDAFVEARAGDSTRWISINFDGWQFEDSAITSAVAALAMTPEEGIETIERILDTPGLQRVVVSTASLEARLDRYVRPAIERSSAASGALPQHARPETHRYVAPEDESEWAMAAIWQELIGIDRVGRLDDFFDLGGHSLLATRVIAHLKQRWAVDLPLKAFFESPTVAELAERVSALRWAAQGQPAVSVIGAAEREEIEL